MKVKKIKSIKRIKEKATVYNFHVPKYESYVANGFITHNCYVARHRDFGNPLYLSENVNDIIETIIDHYYQQPLKYPDYSNQQDRWQWTYDIGESTDMLSPRNIELTEYVVQQLIIRSDLKPTFATKLSNKHTVAKLTKLVRPYRARIRVSLMPQKLADIVELGTTKIVDRIKSIRSLYELNYEVHINLSPVIMYSGWAEDYIQLMKDIDAGIGDDFIGRKIKNQLKAEVIFLTHHDKLHYSNLRWNKEAEDLLWAPDFQEYKTNNRGSSDILRYKLDFKRDAIKLFSALLNKYLPYCKIRYIF
jgi:spore photoproduct lyase